MSKRSLTLALAALVWPCFLVPVAAESSAPASAQPSMPELQTGAPTYVGLAIGRDNISEDGNADASMDFRIEIRPSFRVLKYFGPVLAVEATNDSSVFFGGGVMIDLRPADYLYVTPSFVAGKYDRGDGKDLGGSLQFRSQIEGGYVFGNEHRIGLSISHMSNGGRYDDNPGVEAIAAYYHIPLSAYLP